MKPVITSITVIINTSKFTATIILLFIPFMAFAIMSMVITNFTAKTFIMFTVM